MLSANGGISRFLHPVEHLTLQGFPPEVSAHMTSEQMVHAAGNACSVPVMAAVILQVLCVCPQHSRPDGDAGDVLSVDRSSQQVDRSRQPDSAAKRRCLRDEIASLQAELHALATERRCLEELSYLRSRPHTAVSGRRGNTAFRTSLAGSRLTVHPSKLTDHGSF